MYKKLINIKNLLRIVISLFVIASMAKSCAKAFTFSEFYDFVEETYTNGEQPSGLNNQIECFLNSDVQTAISQKTNLLEIFPNLYTSSNLSIVLYKFYSTGYNFNLRLYEFEDCDCTVGLDGSSIKCNLTNMENVSYAAGCSVSLNNGTITIGSVTNLKTSGSFNSHYSTFTYGTGLINCTDFTNNTTLLFTNEYNTIQPVAFELYPLDEALENGKEVVRLQYRKKDLYLGHFINLIDNNITEIEYTMSFNNGTWAEHGNTNIATKYNDNSNLYMSGDSVYIKSMLLNYYNSYEFNWGAWQGDSLINQGTLYYYVLPINAVVSGGEITNYGSGEAYNTQDSTIDILGFLGEGPSGDDDLGTGLIGSILKGFKNLFVPNEQQLTQWITSTKANLDNRTGIFGKPSYFFTMMLNRSVSNSGDFIITIPDLKITNDFTGASSDYYLFRGNGENNVLNFTQLVNNEPWKTIYDTYIVIISGVYVYAFLSYLWSLYEHILGSHDAESAFNIIESNEPRTTLYANSSAMAEGRSFGYRGKWTGRFYRK